ncbi:Nitrosoguanidine resistance protein SNG1 [Grifola frondosa]|uniref:Nitrosoguanidine resistance protein SNG1 n=1 Tax=Grifola frondosa TaxID=5627 RepID=A0A1C7MA17_GRIFR|nr:Nitrosoguanidine resistance protein SNG1 [Grifola frondosa]
MAAETNRVSIETVHIQTLPPSRSSADRRAEPIPGAAPQDNFENRTADVSQCSVADDNNGEPRYSGFFSPGLASVRRQYFLIIARAVLLISVLIWVSAPVYWGALSNSAKRSKNLEAWFIDRDQSRIGQAIWQAFKNNTLPGPHLNWLSMDPLAMGDDSSVSGLIAEEHAWVAVVIEANTTTTLTNARVNGDKNYDPASAIKMFYSQARNEIATANYIVPITTNLLQFTTSAYATSSAQRYFAQIRGTGDTNDTAVQMIAQAPQTISPAISWSVVNVRPYTAPAAQAVTLVGNIYLCIYAFMITMATATARDLISPHMQFLPMSYALVSMAFHIPFSAKFSEGGGFMLFFCYIYLGMAALGLSMESMITILTPRFAPFFLFILIIYNISPVVLPSELQAPFYRYGDGFPIRNLSQALRTIMFNTKSSLGRNAAVLVAWIIMSCATMTIFTWLIRRREHVRLRRIAEVDSSGSKKDSQEEQK